MESLFLFVGLVFVMLGRHVLLEERRARREFRPAKGRVIGFVQDEKRVLFPVIELHWNGEKRYLRHLIGTTHPVHPVGTIVDLLIDPGESPRGLVDATPLRKFAFVFVAVGLLSIAIFVATFRLNWGSLLFSAFILGQLAWSFRRGFMKKNGQVALASPMKSAVREGLCSPLLAESQLQELRLVPSDVIRAGLSRQVAASRVVGMVLFVLGIAGTYFSSAWLEKRFEFLSSARPAKGVVVKLHTSSRVPGGESVYFPVVRYRHPASTSETEFRHSIGTNVPGLGVGDSVNVLHHPTKPEEAMVDLGLLNYLLPIAALVLSLLLAYWGLTALVKTSVS